MKMCQEHWDKLRAAVEQRGDTRFVAADGKTALERTKRELERTDGPDDFDPLMSSNFAIFNNAMETVGRNAGPAAALSFMGADICPLCELNSLHKRDCQDSDCVFTYDDWIDRAADDAHAYIAAHLSGGAA